MTSQAMLVEQVTDRHAACDVRAKAATKLAKLDDAEVADVLLAIASRTDLPVEVATAAGASLGKVFFRLGRHPDNFAFRDLSDEAHMAFDATVAELLRA